jgi:hypothetical protein
MTVRTLVALVVLLGGGAVLAADPPSLVNYQGVLRDSSGAPVPDGPYAMQFGFFAEQAPGGSAILLDSQTVTATGGLFSVQLGRSPVDGPGPGVYTSLTRVFADFPELYLEVQVGGETLAPRVPLVSAGYALNARTLRGTEVTTAGPLGLYVNGATGDDGNDGFTPARAKRTIQGAVDAIPPVLRGDVTVRIADGTYSERVLLASRTRAGLHWIRLVGNESSPELVALDGTGIPPHPFLDSGILLTDLPVEIAGITVRNFGGAGEGFGIQAAYGTYLRLHHCRFLNNNVVEAAITAADGASIEVEDCVITANSTGVSARNRGSVRLGDGTQVSFNAVAGAVAAHLSQVIFHGSCLIDANAMGSEDHATIRGYGSCIVVASPCLPAAGDPTARCVP